MKTSLFYYLKLKTVLDEMNQYMSETDQFIEALELFKADLEQNIFTAKANINEGSKGVRKLNYGDVFESTWTEVFGQFESSLLAQNYCQGDKPSNDLIKDWFSPVLVMNSDNFLDVEYRFKLDSKIYSLSESLDIQKTLKQKTEEN